MAMMLAGLAATADAQWAWRDKDGKVTASDRPPPQDIPEKDILSRPRTDIRRSSPAGDGPASAAPGAAGAASAPATGKGPLDRELEARKKKLEQEQAAKTAAEEQRLAAQRAENCRRARSQQATLESGQRMGRVNAKGETEILDDRARAEEMRQVREVISSECR